MAETSVLHQAGAEIISLRADNDRLRAELAEARLERDTALTDRHDTIQDLHAELAEAKARIAELEAAGNRLGDAAIAGILDSRDRAERAEAERDAMREALLGLSSAASVLLDEAMGFSVSGVYFSEKCMGHKGPDLVATAIDKVSAVLNRAALNPPD